MSSDGDPEQRIAELERPLPAGTPIEAPPLSEPRRTGMRVGWIVLGLLILGLIVGGIAIVSDRRAASGGPVADTPTGSPIVGGGGIVSDCHCGPDILPHFDGHRVETAARYSTQRRRCGKPANTRLQ